MSPQTWWYLSRASGIVAWVMLAATNLWGVLLVTRILRPLDRPAWLLDLHRWLGALAIVTTAVHLGGLAADSYAHFGWSETLLANTCTGRCWPNDSKTAAVTWGVLAMYVLVVVEVSSLLMRRLPRKLWHGIHLLSYVSFVMATVHGILAGTDRANIVYIVTVSALSGALILSSIGRLLQTSAKLRARRDARTST